MDELLSWNTLTPHYEEDVVYALNAANVAKHFNLDQTSARVGWWGGVGPVAGGASTWAQPPPADLAPPPLHTPGPPPSLHPLSTCRASRTWCARTRTACR